MTAPATRARVETGRTVAKRPPAVRVGLALLAAGGVLLGALALVPRVSDWHVIVVAGGSMEPTIPIGSVTVMRDVEDPRSIEVGAVIEFTSPATGRVTTHRVVARDPEGAWFETRGDANNAPDRDRVPAENVLGRYVFHVPWLGRLIAWMKSPLGYVVTILSPGLVLLALELRDSWREWRRSRR